MTISATNVRFDEHTMWVELTDGRTLGVPLAWFPRLLRATEGERKQVEVSRVGLHWEALDEDISIAGLLAGRGDVSALPKLVSSAPASAVRSEGSVQYGPLVSSPPKIISTLSPASLATSTNFTPSGVPVTGDGVPFVAANCAFASAIP